jgi:hypothetical protein
MDKYFRKIPPIPTNVYLNLSSALKIENRIKLASVCHFPSVINTLARDESYEVQQAARNNPFWVLLGQLQDVLGFEKRERREFARQEVFRIILVLLIFEDDIDILREAMRNASISTRMVTIYIEFLKNRSRGKKDHQILKEAQEVLEKKKLRIVKAAELRKAQKFIDQKEEQLSIIARLADDDHVIRKAVHNLLFDLNPDLLFHFIQLAIDKAPRDKILNQFIVLTELLILISKREDLRHQSRSQRVVKKADAKLSMAEYFANLINDQRLELLDKCQEDLTDFQNILLLTNCHCDANKKIRQIAQNILSLDEIFALVNDISTPQHMFRSILDILTEHPDEHIRKRVSSTYLAESERLWIRLKELEQSINAYFDIIFNSLGFTQINELNISMKNIEQAERTIDILSSKFEQNLVERLDSTRPVFTDIKKRIEMEIYNINSAITETSLKDIDHVSDMIHQIFELKDFGKEGLRSGVLRDIDPDLLNKAHTIWQSALGQFLGRIKHLNEMIKIKFSVFAKNVDKHVSIQGDFVEVVEAFEKDHKRNVNCNLKLACNQCPKRSCAAERFLKETEFFVTELIDNFVPS